MTPLTIPKLEDMLKDFFAFDISDCDILYRVNLPKNTEGSHLCDPNKFVVKPSRSPVSGIFILLNNRSGIRDLDEAEACLWFAKREEDTEGCVMTSIHTKEELFMGAGIRRLAVGGENTAREDCTSIRTFEIDDTLQSMPYNDGTFGLLRTPYRLADNWTNVNGTPYRKGMGISHHGYYDHRKMLACSIVRSND